MLIASLVLPRRWLPRLRIAAARRQRERQPSIQMDDLIAHEPRLQ